MWIFLMFPFSLKLLAPQLSLGSIPFSTCFSMCFATCFYIYIYPYIHWVFRPEFNQMHPRNLAPVKCKSRSGKMFFSNIWQAFRCVGGWAEVVGVNFPLWMGWNWMWFSRHHGARQPSRFSVFSRAKKFSQPCLQFFFQFSSTYFFRNFGSLVGGCCRNVIAVCKFEVKSSNTVRKDVIMCNMNNWAGFVRNG